MILKNHRASEPATNISTQRFRELYKNLTELLEHVYYIQWLRSVRAIRTVIIVIHPLPHRKVKADDFLIG